MRSTRGAIGSGLLLATVPAAFLVSAVAGDGAAELVIHLGLSAGFAVLAFATFDLGGPRWLALAGFAVALAAAVVFGMQAAADLTGNVGLRGFAYDVLGQWLESALIDAVIAWVLATLLLSATGASRIAGIAITVFIAAVEVFRLVSQVNGAPLPGAIKLLYLLPFAWLLWESARPKEPRAFH